MSDENKNSSSNNFSFLDSGSLDQLKSSGLIGDDVYSQLSSKISPPVMSEATSEQMQSIPGEVEIPVASPIVDIPSYAGTPRDANWIAPFSPDAKKQKISEAAQRGDLDSAEKLSRELERSVEHSEKIENSEQEKQLQKFEADLAKTKTYNERALKLGLEPIAEPTPELYGISKSKTKATDADIVNANQPSVEEVEAAAAPVRQVAAQGIAFQNEQAKMAKAKSEQDVANKIEKDKVAAQVSKDIEDEKSENISPFRRAFAIMLGAIGSGLTGKENLGLKAVERLEDQIIEKKKYNDTQKKELRKQFLEEAQFQLKQQEAGTDSIEKQARIRKLNAEIAKLQFENNAAASVDNSMRNSQNMTQEEFLALDPKTQNAFVRLPNGNFAKAIGEKDAAENLRKFMSETGTVVPELSGLRDKIGSTDFSKLDLNDRADVQTRISAIVGALRVPITGPGPMTESEREFIISTIGDPNKIFTLSSIQRAKLGGMISTIEGRVRNQYFNAGINLPLQKNERLQKEVQLDAKRNPGVPLDVLEQIRLKRTKGK